MNMDARIVSTMVWVTALRDEEQAPWPVNHCKDHKLWACGQQIAWPLDLPWCQCDLILVKTESSKPRSSGSLNFQSFLYPTECFTASWGLKSLKAEVRVQDSLSVPPAVQICLIFPLQNCSGTPLGLDICHSCADKLEDLWRRWEPTQPTGHKAHWG
jgi:hypothetical protein